MYRYSWIPGRLAKDELIREMSDLYSEHYGVWSRHAPSRGGQQIGLSPARLREWLGAGDPCVATAYLGPTLIGYAISVRVKVKNYGVISWVTQMVVHEEHRHRGVGKTLLFSIWGFTDHFAWGLLTANPYAVRALEKATRRRCDPDRTARNAKKLASVATRAVPYWTSGTQMEVGRARSRANTEFFLDHTTIEERIARASSDAVPWLLGQLDEGWEWLAFTFKDQVQIGLSRSEIGDMISAAHQVTRAAYSRMTLDSHHRWAAHEKKEVAQIREWCDLGSASSVLDLGCGNGRHVVELAPYCRLVVGVDYVPRLLRVAAQSAREHALSNAHFVLADCRQLPIRARYDAVLCLYDVVGSYAEDAQNARILRSISNALRPGGRALISVMNMRRTKAQAQHWFSLRESPDRLLELPASKAMESTGDVFDPHYYLVDEDIGVVYRKEQFDIGAELPAEYIVTDRRYEEKEIVEMCRGQGLAPLWSRHVRAGKWEEPHDSAEAKEILVLCAKT